MSSKIRGGLIMGVVSFVKGDLSLIKGTYEQFEC